MNSASSLAVPAVSPTALRTTRSGSETLYSKPSRKTRTGEESVDPSRPAATPELLSGDATSPELFAVLHSSDMDDHFPSSFRTDRSPALNGAPMVDVFRD
jgi:hypothetical protein